MLFNLEKQQIYINKYITLIKSNKKKFYNDFQLEQERYIEQCKLDLKILKESSKIQKNDVNLESQASSCFDDMPENEHGKIMCPEDSDEEHLDHKEFQHDKEIETVEKN